MQTGSIKCVSNQAKTGKPLRMTTKLTFHDGTDLLPDGETTTAVVLSYRQLEVEQRQATKEKHDAVWNEEGAWQR